MGNYVIAVGNYVIVSPSELGNCKIVDTHTTSERRVTIRSASSSCRCPVRASPSYCGGWLGVFLSGGQVRSPDVTTRLHAAVSRRLGAADRDLWLPTLGWTLP